MSSPENNFRNLETLLGQISAESDEFAGLNAHSATVHQAFGAEGKVCVVWTLSANHGDVARTGGPFPNERPFLGWYATGRPVQITVVSLVESPDIAGVAKDGAHWHHQWDRLAALAQIGVRAVGRPVLRADNALDR
jgi:hypothetical protein